MKKKLGIIGGMGSHAASWLFKKITDLSYAEKDQEFIEVFLHNNTAIPDRTRAIVYNEASPLPELLRSVRILNNNEVDVAVMACLTAYHFKPSLAPVFNGYFADPIEFTVERLQEMFGSLDGLSVGVVATTGTLRSRIFQKALEPLGAKVVCLEGDDQERYFMGPIYKPDGVKSGKKSPEAVRLFLHQIPLLQEKGADVILGACSEVPLVLNEGNVKMPYVDVFGLLAQKLVDTCYEYI